MTRNEEIRRLENEYREKRVRKERERDARLTAILSQDPQIARLQGEMTAVFLASSRVLSRDAAMAKEAGAAAKARCAELQQEIDSRLAALGVKDDPFAVACDCPNCQDTGYLPGFPRRMCPCMEQRLNERLYAGAGLNPRNPETFETFRKDIYQDSAQREQAMQVRALCANWANACPTPARPFLIISGTPGLGKTFLLNAMTHRLIDRGLSPVLVTAYRLHQTMRGDFLSREEERGAFDSVIRAPVLLIDDLGTEPMMKNITVEYLFILFNERAAAGLPTAVVTNLTPNQLMDRYGERVFSRLFDRLGSYAVQMSGQDLRFRGGVVK